MSGRSSRILLIALGAVAVVAVVAAVVGATRPVARWPRDTPPWVVQQYVTAVIDHDDQAAADLLSGQSPCSIDDLDQAYVPQGIRVVLRDSVVDGDTARVDVEVVRSGEGPFGGFESSEEHTFRLTRAGATWRIAGEPWPMYGCGKAG